MEKFEREIKIIEESGLFDREWYLDEYPDVKEIGMDPVEHYLWVGAKLGRDPYPDFITSSYLSRNPDIEPGNLNPLVHYLYTTGKVISESEPRRMRTPEPAFDTEFYLAAYPDIAEAGIDPWEHYLRVGRGEGRLGHAPIPSIYGDIASFDRNHPTILIVSHDASRTGAPILTLNLVQHFKKQHNVIVLLLGRGELVRDFQSSADIVIGPIEQGLIPHIFMATLYKPLKDAKLAYAIVNSIESRAVLPLLAELFIPTICLIHEFASYTRPRHAMSDAVLWASQVVFSANIVAENARGECPALDDYPMEILPQGRTERPTPEDREAEKAKVGDLVRPASLAPETVVILGVGSVHIRKGVDLFLACAARVRELSPRYPFRFVWAGHGFDPDHDTAYSVYLQDQLIRSGVEKQVTFVGELANMELVYTLSDILFLSSRLDPLPNGAIDAMHFELPVICFDRTTGIAEALMNSGLGENCVAPYLDIEGAAQRIVRLIDDRDTRLRIGRKTKVLGTEIFDMATYVVSLEELAESTRVAQEQERRDCRIIKEAKAIRMDFFSHPDYPRMSYAQIARGFVRSWATGVYPRKPFPGFHPGVYEDAFGLREKHRDPLAHFIEAGCPAGPWISEVITPSQVEVGKSPSIKAALHIHAYYPDLVPEILKRLKGQDLDVDLLISVSSSVAAERMDTLVRQFNLPLISLDMVPNRGRDIGPLLTQYRELLQEKYDLICHVHTKKTVDVKDPETGRIWFRFLVENLIGGRYPMASGIVRKMSEDVGLGLVFPDDPNIIGWSENKPEAEKLAERLDIVDLPDTFSFPVGTMFWARVRALLPLFELALSWEDYPDEPLPYDGTVLHAIERLLPFVAHKQGFRLGLTNVPNLTR
uniref:Glycosyl transferases group 1 n=1 Tax=Candidatus Kentrum sp. FW TaxID=2126338 RepID=A0A450TK15_9GAMM|nr:MAG: Glycosyl transferases group 1 [Candidatus Kentron sp. FW]